MSRSYQHTPITGVAVSTSEKFYKKLRVGMERCRIRSLFAARRYEEARWEQVPWNEYVTDRDGKCYYFKDDPYYQQVMRK